MANKRQFQLEAFREHLIRKRGATPLRLCSQSIGVSPATLSRVERGFPPSFNTLSKIQRWLTMETGNKTTPQSNTPALHPAVRNILEYFAYAHAYVPIGSQDLVNDCKDLAEKLAYALPQNTELTVGLRTLLQATDCFIRANRDNAQEA